MNCTTHSGVYDLFSIHLEVLFRFSMMSAASSSLGSPNPGIVQMRAEERGLCMIKLLIACANHVAAGNIESANANLEYISHLACPDGDTMQRLVSYFAEALADRALRTWTGLHKALNATKPTYLADKLPLQRSFYEVFPFLKLSFVITNQAILEAMEGEKVVHVIDLNCFEPAPWISLLRALSARPEGPPHVKISGVHEQVEVLDRMARLLNQEAEILDIPFQFNPIVSRLECLEVDRLHVKIGEAVAISSVLQLHSLLTVENCLLQNNYPNSVHFLGKNSTDTSSASTDSASSSTSMQVYSGALPRMEAFLHALKRFSPKLMVITEQEASHNGFGLMDRVMESLNYYAALFDCLEANMPRSSLDRRNIEMLLGDEIKDVVAAEGLDRKARHEKLEKWICRLECAGFGKVALSCDVMFKARRLLQKYSCDGYKIRDRNGCFIMCWHDQPLFSVSAWRFGWS